MDTLYIKLAYCGFWRAERWCISGLVWFRERCIFWGSETSYYGEVLSVLRGSRCISGGRIPALGRRGGILGKCCPLYGEVYSRLCWRWPLSTAVATPLFLAAKMMQIANGSRNYDATAWRQIMTYEHGSTTWREQSGSGATPWVVQDAERRLGSDIKRLMRSANLIINLAAGER